MQEFTGVPVSRVRIYAMLLLVAVGNESLRFVVGQNWDNDGNKFSENRSAGSVVKRRCARHGDLTKLFLCFT
jgi:hypothetical protein